MTTIAVLEDSSALRKLLSEILQKRGYTTVAFECVSEARELIKNPPDLLISDIRLTDGNGIDFLQTLREALGESSPPILLLSALGSEEDMLRGFDAGADEYLTKPVSMGELLAKVSMLLARRAARSTPAQSTAPATLPGGALAFGRYEIVRSLGTGSFGEVYEATDSRTQNRIALKVLNAVRGSELQHRQRFLRESYTLSLVHSPHVMELIDYGEQEGRLYAALEYVEGPTLTQHVARCGPLGPESLRSLMSGTVKALAAIGKRGLVHRDIKPDNVILRGGDPSQPVLIDFGLAKSTGDHMLTEVGTLLGTPAFMSPEQIRAGDLDPRSDQFALGLTLRYAALGERAFPKLTGVQLLTALATTPVDVPTNVDEQLRACLLRMIEIQADARYRNLGTLLKDLRADERVNC